MWPSPTQTFGGLLFAGAVLALVDLLRADRRPGAGSWVAFALVLAGATGGKATYAPLLIAGLAAVVGVDLLRRRLNGRAVVAALLAALAFGIADLTMFRGTSAGLFVDPLASLATTYPRTPHPGWTVAHVAAIWLLGWAAVVGAGLILLWRRAWVDPMLPLCAGIGAAALAVVLLTKQMGGSQMYFLVSARPYVAVLVVAALAAVVPGVVAAVPGPGTPLPLRAVAAPGKRLPRVGWAVGEPGRCFPTARWVAAGLREHLPAAGFVGWAAAALGAAVTVAGEHASPGAAPPRGTVAILWPYALPVVVGLVVGGLLRALRWTRPVALVATLAVIVGAGVPTMIAYARFQLPRSGGAAARPDPTAPAPAVIPRGAIEAGRWLRAYTGVDDLLATNDHCRYATGVCDPRQFWLAAFGERRVLVEGWAFTPPANAIASRDRLGSNEIPYWDPAKLAANDAAFTHPTRAAVDRLHSRYGVTWLVVDTRRPADRASLARAATFRYQSGQVAIYQVK
jgi:hypothetical protein